MTFYCIKGEKRRFGKAEPILIDDKMDLKEAEEMIDILKKDHPLWKFWLEEENE
jgi:hypothetical protein